MLLRALDVAVVVAVALVVVAAAVVVVVLPVILLSTVADCKHFRNAIIRMEYDSTTRKPSVVQVYRYSDAQQGGIWKSKLFDEECWT